MTGHFILICGHSLVAFYQGSRPSSRTTIARYWNYHYTSIGYDGLREEVGHTHSGLTLLCIWHIGSTLVDFLFHTM